MSNQAWKDVVVVIHPDDAGHWLSGQTVSLQDGTVTFLVGDRAGTERGKALLMDKAEWDAFVTGVLKGAPSQADGNIKDAVCLSQESRVCRYAAARAIADELHCDNL